MASMFEKLASAARGPLRTVFGSPVRIVCMKGASSGPNMPGAVIDDERPAFDFTARFYQPVDALDAPDRRQVFGNGMDNRALTARGMLTATVDAPTYALRSGDMLRRNSDEQWFQINDVVPDGRGTFTLHLEQAKTFVEPT